MKNIVRIILVAILLASCGGDQQPALQKSAVAMPDSYSAVVAAEVLNSGGNAVDAAIAAAFSLAVTFPEAGNIGGGGFMLVHVNGKSEFIDYREIAPLASHRDMYLDENGDVTGRSSLIGHSASGVPGTIAGLWLAHQRFASLPWADLVAPAINLARRGFIVPESLAVSATDVVAWHENAVDFEEQFGALRAGETFIQHELADTLQRIAQLGADDFYRGETARLIVDEMNRGGGLITAEDLENYEAIVREPLRAEWRGLEFVSAPPPSSGGLAVLQILKMRDFLADDFSGLSHNSPQYIHLVSEISKRVFADRAEFLGDPDSVDIPLQTLISDDYLRNRAAEVSRTSISTIDAVKPGLESPHTTHFSIRDRQGNAVANTYTLNWDFGSGIVVDGAGFLLNGEMDDFSVKPDVANVFGVVGGTANEIQPGKRMLSSMAPTMLLRDGEVELVVGSPGGSTIISSVSQTIANIYDFGMNPRAAVAAARFHHQLLPPDLLTFSPGIPLSDETLAALRELGYRVEPHSWEFGDVQVIYHAADELKAASDPRKRGESRILLWEVQP